ncbi:hypothetical protein ABPG73_011041 [Tetrahymena malaccensis]
MDQQTHRSIQKKDKKRLFQEQIIEGSKQNDVTFNLNGLHINSQTRREEINSLIDHQNELVSQGSPSLNQFLQTSQISKTQIQSEKYKSLIVDKNEFQDSINESDKELPTVSQVQNTVQRSRSSNHLKSIFLSDNNKKHIQRSKQNLKVMMGFRGSQVQEKKFINFVLLKQIHQKMTYFLNNFTSTGRIKFLNNEKHLQIRKAINDNVDYIQPKNNDKVVLFIRCIFNYLSCFSVFKWFCQNSCCFIIVPNRLQGRVNLDLEYQYLHNLKQDQEQKEEVISKISPHLQKLLKVEQTKQALEKFNFLSKYFSKETMQDLSLEFNEEFYSPNQVVFQDKQVNNLSMILILQGSLQICQQIDKQTQPVQFLKEGDIIGQINFFTGLEFQYSVKSVDFTKVIKINREKFLEIIQKREKDYEKYCQIRDKQQFYMQYNTVQVKCAFCHQYTHLTTQCSLVHLDTQGSVFVAKFQQNFQQTRSKYLRKQIDQNSYMIRLAVQKSVNKYMLEEKKAQKINTFIQKKNNLLSNDSNEYESENSIRMFSTYQILSSQQSSEEENQQSTVMAQKVKNSRYFDSNKIIQLNQNTHKRKKSQEITSLRDINTQQTQPLNHIQLDIVNKYYDQTKKRGSIFQTKKDKKHRNSIQVIDFNKKNYIQEVESVSKRLSAQFQNNNFNSSNQNDDSPHVKSKQRITQDMSMTPSNSIQKQEQQIGFQQQHNTSKLVNSKKRDKKTDYENYIRRAQKRQTSIIQKPMSQIQILEEEKNQPLFIFDFDIHKQWQIYFPQGNLVNILQKFNKRMRKKTKHYTVYDKKKDKTEKKQAD